MPELFSREPNLTRIWVDRQMNKIPPFDSAQSVKMCKNYILTIYTLSSASETSLTISMFTEPGNANEFCFRFRFERKLLHHFIGFRIFWILIISVLCLQIFEAIDSKFAGCWMNEWMNERKNQIVRGFRGQSPTNYISHETNMRKLADSSMLWKFIYPYTISKDVSKQNKLSNQPEI